MCDANLDTAPAPRPLEPGEALGGFIFPDDVNPAFLEDYGAFGVIGLHVLEICHAESIIPTGVLSTKGNTDMFTDARIIRWQLRPIGADQPVDLC